MRSYKNRGFISSTMAETLGTKRVTLRGTAANNNAPATVRFNDAPYTNISQRGITVITMSEDFVEETRVRYDIAESETARNNLASFLGNLPANKYFLLLTYNSIRTNPSLTQAFINLGSVRFQQLPLDAESEFYQNTLYGPRTPYVAIIGSEVGVCYEAIGSSRTTSLSPHAVLDVVLPELQYLGCQGFGENLTGLIEYEGVASTDFNVSTTNSPSPQYVKYSMFANVIDQNPTYSAFFNLKIEHVDSMGNVQSVLVNEQVKSFEAKKYTGTLPPISFGSYKVSFIGDGVSEFKVTRISFHKAGVNNPLLDGIFGVSTEEILSSLSVRDSMFGAEPYYGDGIQGAYNTSTKLFDDIINVPIYDISPVLGALIDGPKESYPVDIRDVDDNIMMNAVMYSASPFSPSVSVNFYDINDNLIETVTPIEYQDSIPNDRNVFFECYAFKDTVDDRADFVIMQNYRYGSVGLDYGYSATPTINDITTIPPNAAYMTYTFDKLNPANYYIGFPCAKPLTSLLSRKGYVSPVQPTLEVPTRIPIDGLLFRTSEEVEIYKQEISAPTPQSILDEWPRTDGATYFPDPGTATGYAARWYYDASTNSFRHPDNTSRFISIWSPDRTDNYEFETYLHSTNSDDDYIGLIAAADFINGEMLMVTAGVHSGGFNKNTIDVFSMTFLDSVTGYNSQIGLVLTDTRPPLKVNPSPNYDNPRYGWNNKKIRIRVVRQGSILTATVSDWNSDDFFLGNQLSVDLSTLPRNGNALAFPARYGFCTFSQAQSSFLEYQISGDGVYDRTKLYNASNSDYWRYTGNSWVLQETKLHNEIIPPRTVTNPLTKQTFEVNFNGAELVNEEGILGTAPGYEFPANDITTIPHTEIKSFFTYSENFDIESVPLTENCDVAIDSTNIYVETFTDEGSFWVYFKATDGTIAFKEIPFTIL